MKLKRVYLKMKFKEGDKVVLATESTGYGFFHNIKQKYTGIAKGDILTIGESKVGSGYDDHERVYGFKEDTTTYPHWLNVEKNFKLVKNNWKERLK